MLVGHLPVMFLLKKQFGGLFSRPVLLAVLASMVFLCLFLGSNYFSDWLHRWLGNYLGVMTLGFFTASGFLLVCKLFPLTYVGKLISSKAGALSFAAVVSILSAIAMYNFHKPIAIEEYILQTDKVTRDYRFVHISDIQYGTSTKAEMDEIIETAYSLDPDFIVFTGDLVDFDNYQSSDFDVLASSEVPIFFERGNHEFYHHPERLMRYLSRVAPIQVLANKKTYFEELEIVGLDFSRVQNNVLIQMQRLRPSSDRFSILLYHEPRDVRVAADAGFDLLLYGHTHAGQIWPFTWVIDLMYEFGDGPYHVGEAFAYTTDGASLWGPRMRLGSQNEIVLFTVKPSKAEP